MNTTVLLADDHQMLRESLARALTEHGMDVVGQARDGEEAIRLAQELQPDVILMDVTMPNVDGLESTRRIHLTNTSSKIVMLTMHADHEVFADAVRSGAVGYLIKDSSIDDVVRAIEMATKGEPPLSPQLATSMLAEVESLTRSTGLGVVTRREEAVLQLIADGCSTTEVAERLFISSKTVKNHLATIYAKLEAQDRTAAMIKAVRLGIVHLR